MKKLLSLLLCLALSACCVFSLASCGESELSKAYDKYLAEVKAPTDTSLPVLTVATSPDFAPMEFSDLAKSGQDQYVGFDLLLANYLAKELNMQLVIKPLSFDACMAAVQSGNADLGISGFSWTAARAETFLISDYYIAGENETEQVTIVKTGTSLTTAASYAGKKVGVQGGSLQELLVKEQLETQGAQVVTMENLNDLATALVNGQIDALACAKGNADAYVSSYGEDKLALSGFSFEVEEKYKNNVVLLNKTATELCDKVNAALAKALESDYYTGWYEACEIYAGINTMDELGYDEEGNKITQ